MSSKMRIVFMGTPDFAVPVLKALVTAGHEVVAAYSQPPRPGGRRGKELTPSPVHKCAEELGIEVRTPLSLKGEEAQAEFAALGADVAVVAAYGLILPQAVLDAPKHGCLNVHGSLLPRWRGAAPVQRAILAGDMLTGVGIMQMEAGLDTGPVRAEAKTAVDGKTGPQLMAELAEIGAALMVEVLADLPGHSAHAQPEEGVTYARKIDKAETRLDFSHSAELVERQVRAFYPLAWFELEGERYRVLEAEVVRRPGLDPGPVAEEISATGILPAVPGQARDDVGVVMDDQLTVACGFGAIRPRQVQRAGRPAMATADLLRGKAIPAGTKLG